MPGPISLIGWFLTLCILFVLLFYGYVFVKILRTRFPVWPFVRIEAGEEVFSIESLPTENPYAPPQSSLDDTPIRYLNRTTTEAESLGYQRLGDFRRIRLVRDKLTGQYRPEPLPKLMIRMMISPVRDHIALIAAGRYGLKSANVIGFQTLADDGRSFHTIITKRYLVDLSRFMEFQVADDMNFLPLLSFHEAWLAERSAQIRQYSETDPVADLSNFAFRTVEICHDRKTVYFLDKERTNAKYTTKGVLQVLIQGSQARWSDRRVSTWQRPAWLRPLQIIACFVLGMSLGGASSGTFSPQVTRVAELGIISSIGILVISMIIRNPVRVHRK